jgi:hypothetical protein
MRTFKVIAGLVFLAAALPLGMFAWVCFIYGALWFKFIPIAFTLGLAVVGIFLILRRSLVMSARAKMAIIIFFGILIASPALVDIHIRQERKALQERAKALLARPIPKLLIPNSEGEVGGY